MLRTLRIIFAALFFVACLLLFVDFTGFAAEQLGWAAKIQFIPALIGSAASTISAFILGGIVVLTLLFGRIYCSTICPLGVAQDVISNMTTRKKKNKFSYAKPKTALRIAFLALFVLAFALGFVSLATLIDPYSAFGRIATNLLSPIWAVGNNALAFFAEFIDSYAFRHSEIYFLGFGSFAVALVTFALIGYLSWKGGRDYCNTVCPVGTVLGFISKYAIFRPVIDTSKCNSCGLCARNCKAKCINPQEHKIDYSRCVDCFDCIGKCRQSAISYTFKRGKKVELKQSSQNKEKNKSNFVSSKTRRGFFATLAFLSSSTITKAVEEKTTDGGYAPIKDRIAPKRSLPILPPGARDAKNFSDHCTACQLCVSACPSNVLVPSTSLKKFMQPELSYERGYCDINCVECSKVCPTGAIKPIEQTVKANTQIGRAFWVSDKCVVNSDNMQCDNCFRQCPTGAIQMIPKDPNDPKSLKIPAIDETRCIGCGACENLCLARPIAAIYVTGNSTQIEI